MRSPDKYHEFRHLKIYWRFSQLTEAIRAQLVDFWLTNGAITNADEAWRRTAQVGCVVLNCDDQIVGVNSFYLDRLVNDGRTYWFYRTFIHPDYRVMGLTPRLFNLSFDYLSALSAGKTDAPAGIMFVTENPKLESRAGTRIFQRNGLQHLGKSQEGKSVWRKCFAL